MVNNIVVLGGSSHPALTISICSYLGIAPAQVLLGKFAVGETRVEIKESVRGKDVFIVQSGGRVNDCLIEILITISACKIASASRITAILPLFPYSRQNDRYSEVNGRHTAEELAHFEPQRGYREWSHQSGRLVADLLTSAGADHIITMDLHDPQYQGFFDIPVDNLYGRPLLQRYISSIPGHHQAVIVSPDAGGAKRATVIADSFDMPFALIHKERRTTQFSEKQNASMMLVGDVAGKTAILIDDMADTCTTVTRAAKLLKREGATQIYALVTHGILSGDGIERLKASPIDKLVVTNSVDQAEHKQLLGDRLDVLEVGSVFAEAVRRVHYGESISVLFQHN